GLLEANDIHNNGIAGFGRQPDSDSGALRDPPRTDGWLVRARPVHRQPHPFPQQPHRNEIYNGHQGGVFILGEGRGLIEHNMWLRHKDPYYCLGGSTGLLPRVSAFY
ncbi:uncharacterized protein LOC120356395, partial [Nilaparvata lugens]|uniref:uncharacterized protein LOC120356395 n=1 Tax=Nilaparvata lugens TaxID=108931 RepID=UPI00193CF850